MDAEVSSCEDLRVATVAPDSDWEETLDCATEEAAYPLLFRSDGSLYQLNDHTDLLKFDLQENDLYVVGPHGEIVPFIALAFRQRLLQASGAKFFQIDAHYDGYKSRDPGALATILAEFIFRKNLCFYSDTTRKYIGKFLVAEEKSDIEKIFEELCSCIKDDLETFIASVRDLFSEVIAFIRPEGKLLTVSHRPSSFDDYIQDRFEVDRGNRTSMELFDVIEQYRGRFNFYSIDGDFTGVTREKNRIKMGGFSMESLFEVYMDYLLEGLTASVSDGDGSKSLYGVSLHKRFVKNPALFIKRLIKEFYLPCVIDARCAETSCAAF